MNNPIVSLFKNKFVLLTASFFITVLFLFMAINMLRRQQAVPPIQPPIEEPTPIPLVIPTVPVSESFVISGVTVKNFYKNPEDSNSTSDVLFFENADYSMTYVGAFEQFYISISNTNFLSTRDMAETKFLSILGISKLDACKLKVEESVPIKSKSPYAGGVYPLSFCESSN